MSCCVLLCLVERQKVVRTYGAFRIFTSECASHHDAVHCFFISTSKSAPRMVCFAHFDFEICFAPQRRAILHLLCGQMAPHLAALASLLFDPPEPQIIGKTQFRPFRAPTSFSSDSFSSLIFFLFLFSDSSHLCFSICPYCRKFDL